MHSIGYHLILIYFNQGLSPFLSFRHRKNIFKWKPSRSMELCLRSMSYHLFLTFLNQVSNQIGSINSDLSHTVHVCAAWIMFAQHRLSPNCHLFYLKVWSLRKLFSQHRSCLRSMDYRLILTYFNQYFFLFFFHLK